MRRMTTLLAVSAASLTLAFGPSFGGAAGAARSIPAIGQCGAFVSDAVPRPGHSQTFADVGAIPGTKAAWAVGAYHDNDALVDRTLIERWNGSTWKQVDSPSPGIENHDNDYLFGVTALSATDAWAVGYRESTDGQHPLIEHWNGTRWKVAGAVDAGTYSSLRAVAAVAADDVWAVGHHFVADHDPVRQETLAEHWDGSRWSIVPTPNVGDRPDNLLVDVAAVPGTDQVIAVGTHQWQAPKPLVEAWDGSDWTVQPTPRAGKGGAYLNSVSALAPDQIWTVGFSIDRYDAYHGLTARWNGSGWQRYAPVPPLNDGYDPMLNGITALAPDDVWLVGTYYNGLSALLTLAEHWNGSGWMIVPSENPGGELDFAANVFNGVAAISPSDVRAVGYYHLDDQQEFDPNHALIEHWCA